MGYKLAGYEVLGGVEIDPEMMKIYKANHNPKHSYLMGIQEFNKIPAEKLPAELLNLDILDGSPPCSSFSLAGSREEAWGEKKKFREGQTSQVLDDLFFHFIRTASILRPKVIIAENVKGLTMGKAKGYVKQIAQGFDDAGYTLQLFLLNAAFMGVPQRRERVFFIASRKDLKLKSLKMDFRETPFTVKEAFAGVTGKGKEQTKSINLEYWRQTKPGNNLSKVHPKGNLFNIFKLDPYGIAPTLSATARCMLHWDTMRNLCKLEYIRLQTFPDDYQFKTDRNAGYICGMSVPPFMMQRVAVQVLEQWLSKP